MKDDINEIIKKLDASDDLEKKLILTKLLDDTFFLDSILDIFIQYGKFIDTNKKIEIILNLKNDSNIIKYMTINELEIRSFLKENIILNLCKMDIDLKNICFINLDYVRYQKSVDLFYNQFKDYIWSFKDEKYNEYNYFSIFSYISGELLFSLIFDEDNINHDIIFRIACNCVNNETSMVSMDALCYIYFNLSSNDKYNFKMNISSFILNECYNRKRIISNLSDFNRIDEKYFECLKYLKKLDKKSRKKLPLYIKAYNLFLAAFIKNFNENLDQNDYTIIRQLFERIINGMSLIHILRIDNKKTLYHFYKTNEFIDGDKFKNSLEEIKTYNAKQYLNLTKLIYFGYDVCSIYTYDYEYNREYKYFIDMIRSSEKILETSLLETLIYYGYDILYKMKDDLLKNLNILYYGMIDEINDAEYKKTILKLLPFLKSINDAERREQTIFILKKIYIENNNIKNGIHITEQMLISAMTNPNIFLLPNNINLVSYLEKLNLIKKGDILLEKYNAAVLYNKYKNRFLSSIPNIDGVYENVNYQMVDLHSEEILINGIDSYILPQGINVSCLTPNGKASTSLEHGATNVNGRFFKISKDNNLLCYSWVWRSGDVLCFDNIEVTKNLLQIPNYEKIVYQIYYNASKQLVKITNINEQNGIKMVVIGRTPKDVKLEHIDQLKDTTFYKLKPFKPNADNEIYLEDSKDKQVVIYMTDVSNNTNDVIPIYKRERNKIQHFNKLTSEILEKIKSIYFDYCIENCEKYEKEFNYIEGYIGEDWFLGITENNNREFYCYGDDIRLFEETKEYGFERKKIDIVKSYKDKILEIIESKEQLDDKFFDYFQNLDSENLLLPKEFYFHAINYSGDYNLNTMIDILKDGEIRSYSKRNINVMNNGANGNFFISITKNNEDLYQKLKSGNGIVIDSKIMAFETYTDPKFSNNAEMYPCLRKGICGEYQVFQAIPINKFLALQVSINQKLEKLVPIGKIVYLMELLEMDIPIITSSQKVIDKEKIKRLVKLK